MNIIIHTRHAELASDFKSITEGKLHSMERFSVVIDRIEVEVIHEANPRQGKQSHKVIITSHGSGPLLRAEATGFNDVAAFDDAIKSIVIASLSLYFYLYLCNRSCPEGLFSLDVEVEPAALVLTPTLKSHSLVQQSLTQLQRDELH